MYLLNVKKVHYFVRFFFFFVFCVEAKILTNVNILVSDDNEMVSTYYHVVQKNPVLMLQQNFLEACLLMETH